MANTLRGGFGAAFKHLVCVYRPPQPCDPCLLRHTCPYGALFETARPPDSPGLRRDTDIPRPFVLEPPLDSKTRYEPGEVLEVGLVLVGRAIGYLPYFLVAFQELGRAGLGATRGKFTVKDVHAVNALTGQEVLLYAEGKGVVADPDMGVGLAEAETTAASLAAADEITLRFLSPTRLLDNNRLVAKPEFLVLVRALVRRISSLAAFYCGDRSRLDLRPVVEAASRVTVARSNLRWWDWQRYSARQRTQMKLGGFVGEVTYRGPLQAFLPLLLLGTITHVGKACTFGHGRYELI